MEAPNKIYLTNGDREHLINFDSDVADGLVMWCEDKITDHDVEYIRKDLLLAWAEDVKKGLIVGLEKYGEPNEGRIFAFQEFIDKINSL